MDVVNRQHKQSRAAAGKSVLFFCAGWSVEFCSYCGDGVVDLRTFLRSLFFSYIDSVFPLLKSGE